MTEAEVKHGLQGEGGDERYLYVEKKFQEGRYIARFTIFHLSFCLPACVMN